MYLCSRLYPVSKEFRMLRKLFILPLLVLLAAISGKAQVLTNPNGVVLTPETFASANLTAQAASCSVNNAGAVLRVHLPSNAVGAGITLAGTFSGTATFSESGDNQITWPTTAGTSSAAGLTQITFTGITDLCVYISTYTSGTFTVSINVTLNTGPAGPPGPSGGASSTTSSSVSTVATFFPATSSSCALSTYSASGTNYCMINAITGAITTNTDFRPLWDAAVSAFPNGGHFFLKQGTYNCNTLDTESTGGFSNVYCMGFPGGGTTQYTQWIVEGEIGDQVIDQFGTPVQTSGTIINLTAAAISSVALHTKITVLWARKDVTNNVGASVRLKNLGIRVPTNQRGCETGASMQNVLNVEYDHVFVDTAVVQTSLAFPVQDACTAWGETDPGGLIGLTSVNSAKQHSDFSWAYTMGADVGLDVRAEHSTMVHSAALDGNHGIDYGVRGGPIYHTSFWDTAACGEVARCLTFGANMQLGSALTAFGFDIEDANGGGGYAAFVPVYHFAETNAGNTNGLISYSDTLQSFGLIGLPNVFDGGGGGSFAILQATSQHNIARTPGQDSFTRANQTPWGPAWALTPFSATPTRIVSNTAQCNSAATINCGEVFVGQQFPSSDQFSQVTISANDANIGSFAEVLTNQSPSAVTFYSYYCGAIAARGSGIFKEVAGVQTILVSQTASGPCPATTTIKLVHIGTWLYAFKGTLPNLVLDTSLSPNPISDSSITGGNPGIVLGQDTTGGVSVTNFIGGNFPTLSGTDSVYDSNNPTFAPFLLSIGTAPTPTGTGACATITTQVPASLGNRAGNFKCTGVTGASTMTLTFAVPAPNGYRCNADDSTTVADKPNETSWTQTTCVLTTAATAANDVIVWSAEPF
jgi:hypothetical protein